ncbi:hypothetical protein [Prochlorococcus marinus]|uniref:hypothetical protein n=1 Tax=Prochlorococcus marinus TaxID=1219 RepID=UPI001F3E4499|nr:hypothetical protein [Prochlorococcus marinus]
MRDPIERVISSQRIKLRKRGKLSPDEEVESLRSLVKKLPKRFSIRSNYVHTLNVLQESFGLENRFINFYETLFTTQVYSQLCGLLNINYEELNWG